MYRVELEPLPLNTRRTQRFWMLVVAVLSFGAGAATVGYVYRSPRFAAAEPAAPSPAAAPRQHLAANSPAASGLPRSSEAGAHTPVVPLLAPGQITTLPLPIQRLVAQATRPAGGTVAACSEAAGLQAAIVLTLPPQIHEQVRPRADTRQCRPNTDQ